MTGYARTQEAIARLLTRLQVVPMISGLALGADTASPIGQQSFLQFTIDGTVVTAPAPTTAGTVTPGGTTPPATTPGAPAQ